MNVPPREFIRVPSASLERFTQQAFEKAGMSPDDARVMGDLLVQSDLRGVFSHGTQQIPRYVNLLQRKQANPRPVVKVIHETPTTAVIDGDGGLGYFPCLLGARMATERAKAMGLGAVTTRGHDHFGAAGIYTRIAAEGGCAGFAVSSHIPRIKPATYSVLDGCLASPMSFAFPNGAEPPVVLDMAVRLLPSSEDLMRSLPATAFKSIGLGAVCAALGRIMAGVDDLHQSDPTLWPAFNQGAFIMAIQVERFIPLDVFKRDMDELVRETRKMRPLPGYDRADLPGNLEWEREREWRALGVPVGRDHQQVLDGMAKALGIPAPW